MLRSRVFTLTLCLLASAAQSALIDRGGGFIYDDVLDITWTQNAGISSEVNWIAQSAWADSLSLYDSVRDVTWDDWRLGSMDVNGDDTIVDCRLVTEPVCRDNEYGYLFVQYGVSAGSPGLFTNIPLFVWSGTSWVTPGSSYGFLFGIGFNAIDDWESFSRGWAVRDGDVALIPDADSDGIMDATDNCTFVANPTQCDSDADGYGNHCDGDLGNPVPGNGATNAQDYVLFRAQLGQPSITPTYNPADINCNGAVNAQDYVLFRQLLGEPPGPSGLVP